MTERKLIAYIAELLEITEKSDLILSEERKINYGIQLLFSKGDNEITLNIYYSKKKGISTVIGGSSQNKLRPLLQKILGGKIKTSGISHKWKIWAGTDESGKGDFFGALVACGFIVHNSEVDNLKKIGVQDSKLLKDEKIIKIAQNLHQNYSKNFEVIILEPSKYNELYKKFKLQGKKLNELLAWMHSRIIINLKQKHNFEGAVVDKFASDRTLLSALKGMNEIKLQHKIKAESDIAVASASILARYYFLRSLKNLNQKFQMEFSKGASTKVIQNAQQFADKYGKKELGKVAKIHFKTYEKIKEKE